MAAEAKRAPRLACGLTSMAAAVAIGRAAHIGVDCDMPAAWAAVFQAADGMMIVDGSARQSLAFPNEFAPVSQLIGTTVFTLCTPDERRGALKALGAVLDLCGRATRDEVFSFACAVGGEG